MQSRADLQVCVTAARVRWSAVYLGDVGGDSRPATAHRFHRVRVW